MFSCPKENCDKEYDNVISLSKHWKRTHKETAEDLYNLIHSVKEIPKCTCGCGEQSKFLGIARGYTEYVLGHASRVKNNFVSKKAQENSAKTRRKMIKDGTWKPFALKETGEAWNLGLTKETDQRIANMAESISGNAEEIAKRSQRMKKGRLDGTVPTLYGKDHSQWKGGISSLSNFCRKTIYEVWVVPCLKAAKNTCKHCSTRKRLQVHHDKETFSQIYRAIAIKNKWEENLTSNLDEDSFELLKLKIKIAEEVAEYHINNNVSGIVLCKSCHKKEHGKLNF